MAKGHFGLGPGPSPSLLPLYGALRCMVGLGRALALAIGKALGYEVG